MILAVEAGHSDDTIVLEAGFKDCYRCEEAVFNDR